jgi:hypothetical protein
MKYLLTFASILVLSCSAQAQSNWSIQTAIGVATETNLGDTGLRLSTKASRQIGKRWNAFAQIGTFQMFSSNENWSGDLAYQEKRSLSTTNFDLGGSLFLLNKSRVKLGIQGALTARAGRQLWPEFSQTVLGNQVIYYTYEKIREVGYAVGIDFSIKANDRIWIGMDTHCHNYNYLGEYLGVGLSATFRL